MDSFLIGAFTVLFTVIMAQSYMTKPQKQTLNRVTANPSTDIIITVALLVFFGAGGFSTMMLALGIGVGVSLALKGSTVIYGKGNRRR
ncbi:MAG: hypothetical protein DRP45_10335 [Candidatus Zixiibacteriota bacterium]|nr:MAG: hypothetical protein DRP45_10335 [candidate division Zixibacteria bacterium]